MRRTGTAVEDDERRGRSGVARLELACHAVPGPRLFAGEREGHRVLAHIHVRDSTSSARLFA